MQPNCSRPRRSPRLPLVALTIGSLPASGIDNGLGITPPRGWRSWNLFHGAINDTVMRAQMAAVLDKSRSVDGKPTSLAELGFDWISMDDGWQQCNCSFPGFPSDPSLPKCPNCKEGGCSWHSSDAEGGRPLVDSHKFPDMKGLVDYGHSLGLKVGSYLNNCICMEGGDPPMGQHCNSPTHYQQDVDYIISTGFDGVKIDNCGSSHNVTHWAYLFNKSGKAIRIESCHTFHPNHHTPSSWPNFPVWDPATKAADAQCPMNMYRTGGDIGPNFNSVIGEAYAVVQYGDRPDPLSHPGCWAYPDMSEVGNFRGADPLRTDEERTHWGLWCILSSPLILGLDMSRGDTMDRVWPTITNPDALAVNDAWAGHPGTLIKSYVADGDDVSFTVDQAPCDGSPRSLGWRLEDGRLLAPGAGPLCLDVRGGPAGQDTSRQSSCPPPTTRFGGSGCGSLLAECSRVRGSWDLDAATGLLRWRPTGPGPVRCLAASPASPVGGFYGGPVAANTALGGCRASGTTSFNLTARQELRSASGVCLVARRLYGPQLWSKPLPAGRAAALVVNLLEQPQAFSLPLADVPGLACSGSCSVRDVWARKDLPPRADFVHMELRAHESAFFVVGPAEVPAGYVEPATLVM